MEDFTKKLNSVEDFTAGMQQENQMLYPEDPALSEQAASMVTWQAKALFDTEVPPATTQGDLEELNQIVYEDYNTTAQEADTEAMVDLVGAGVVKDPTQASAMLYVMTSDAIGKDTALLEVASDKIRREAIKDGDIADVSQKEAITNAPEAAYLTDEERKQLRIGIYNTPEKMQAKRLVLQQRLANLSEERSLSDKAAYEATGLVPFVSGYRSYTGSLSGIPAFGGEGGVLTNRTLEDLTYFDSLILNPYLSPEQLNSMLAEYENKVGKGVAQQKYQSMFDRSMFSDQFFEAVDVASVAAGAAKVARTGKTAYNVSKVAGETTKEVAEEVIKTTLKEAGKEAVAQVPGLTTVSNVVAHPVKTLKMLGGRSQFAKALSADVIPAAALEDPKASKLALEEIVNTAVSPRMTRENVSQVSNMPEVVAGKESLALTKDLTYRIDTNTGALDVMNSEHLEKLREEAYENFLRERPRANLDHADLTAVRVDPIKNSLDETYTFRYQIGTGVNNAQPFKTKEAAEKYAAELRIKSSSQIIQDTNGFWIQFDTTSTNSLGSLADQAFKSAAQEGGLKNVKESASGGLTAPFRGVSAQSTVVRRMNALTQHEKDSFLVPLLRDAIKSMTNLNKLEKAELDIVVNAGRKAQQWISTDWLKANGASDAVINAYINYRALNDTHYLYANRALKKQMTERGGVEVFFGGNRKGIEYEVAFDDSLDTSKYWFRVDGSDEIQHLSQSQLRDLKDRGYRMTETIYGDKDVPATLIRHVYNPTQYEGRTLKGMVIDYVAGGRDFYSDSNMFIKQLEMGEAAPRYKGQRITHPKYISGVRTITAGESIQDARKFAELLENARQTLIKYQEGIVDAAQATAELQAGLGSKYAFAGTVDSFSSWAQEHKISLHPAATIEAVKDGETLASYTSIMREGFTEDLIEGVDKFKRSASSLYSEEMKVRKRLRTGGDIEEIFDGFTPVRMNPEQEMKRLVNEIIDVQSMRAFTDLFKDNFKRIYKDVIDPAKLSGNILDESALMARTSSNKDVYDSAKSAIRQHRIIRNIPNRFDEKILEGFEKVAQSVGVSEDAIKKVYGLNAPQKVRELVSWLNFGGSPAQILRQGSAIMNTHLQAVGASLEADWLSFLYPFFATKDKKIIEHGLRACGKSLEDVSELTRFFDNIDKIRSKGRYVEGGVIDPGTDFSKTFVKGSYYFYTKGESINRVHSAITTALVHGGGWKNNKFKKIDYASLKAPELAEIANRYNRYYMNMDAAGMAPVQASKLFQTVFQFQTYKMRWFEILADSEFTKAQKGAFFLGHLALFGTMGLGLGNVTLLNNDKASDAVSMGILNFAMDNIFGENSYIPDLSELGASHATDFFSYGLEAGKTLTDLPMLRAANQIAQAAFRVARAGAELYKTPEYTSSVFLENMKDLVLSQSNPMSGLARSARSVEAFITNSLENSRGVSSAKDISTLNTVLYALGFDNLRDSQMYTMSKEYSKVRQQPKEIANFLKRAFLNYIKNPADNDAWIAYATLRKNIMQDVPYTVEVEVNKILDRAARENKDSFDRYLEIKLKHLGYTNPEIEL